MNDKIDSIEVNVEKSNRRAEICNQAVQWLNSNKSVDTLRCATLPAKHYLFEHLLNNTVQNSPFLNKPVNVLFFCAEHDLEVLADGLKYKPSNAIVAHATFESMLACGIVEGEVESKLMEKHVAVVEGWVSEKGGATKIEPNFVWGDYCSQPSKEKIHESVTLALSKKNQEGLYYFTFTSNHFPGGKESIPKSLGVKTSKHNPLQGGVEFAIEREFRNALPKNMPFSKIYSVHYSGGTRSQMVTVGFMVGKGDVKTIRANYFNEEIQKERQEKHRRMKEIQNFADYYLGFGYHVARIAKDVRPTTENVKSVKSESNTLEKKGEVIKAMFVKCNTYDDFKKKVIEVWENSDKQSKPGFYNMIAENTMMTRAQVRSILAWHTSPALIAKCA